MRTFGTKNRIAVSLITVVLLTASGVTVLGQERTISIYKDNNGYFAARPPEGWKQQDYPTETVRSKVAFNDPRPNGPSIRIIAGPTPQSGYSLDDLLAENREKINTVFKQKLPNGVFSVSKEKVGDREAVVMKNSIPGNTEQKVVMFVNKNLWYSIAFNAKSRKEFDSVTDRFQKFLNSFTILETGRKFSDAEMRAAVVAKYKRLAEIYQQSGNTTEALAWIKEGLEVDPTNKGMLDIKAKLTKK